MPCPISMLKLLTLVGMWMTAFGTILLWRSSPSGYALSGYGGGSIVSDNNKRNMRMRKHQWLAITLIVLGTGLQMPLLLYG